MEGYIIKDITCVYVLSSFLRWTFVTDYPGYVFTDDQISEIARSGKTWDIQPVFRQHATWTLDSGVVVTGQIETLYAE